MVPTMSGRQSSWPVLWRKPRCKPMSKIKLIDKRSKAEKKADAARSRNGSWSAFRPTVMKEKTKYARKGRRRAEENW